MELDRRQAIVLSRSQVGLPGATTHWYLIIIAEGLALDARRTMAPAADSDLSHASSSRRLFTLALGSVGVIYGDIGTSPLYAFREALKPIAHDGVTRVEIIGLISLMIWSLTIIVTLRLCPFPPACR